MAILVDSSNAIENARDEINAALNNEPSAAKLGVMLDQIIFHGVSDGAELDLLEQVSGIWLGGIGLYDQFTAARKTVETIVSNPSEPGSLDALNSATAKLKEIQEKATTTMGQITAIRDKILTRAYLGRHPRQADMATSGWDWGNLFLARRTDAFVRATFAASSSAASMAFATGVLASWQVTW